MPAVKVQVWLSEAGNYHVNREAAEADTLAAALDRYADKAQAAEVSRDTTKGPHHD